MYLNVPEIQKGGKNLQFFQVFFFIHFLLFNFLCPDLCTYLNRKSFSSLFSKDFFNFFQFFFSSCMKQDLWHNFCSTTIFFLDLLTLLLEFISIFLFEKIFFFFLENWYLDSSIALGLTFVEITFQTV